MPAAESGSLSTALCGRHEQLRNAGLLPCPRSFSVPNQPPRSARTCSLSATCLSDAVPVALPLAESAP